MTGNELGEQTNWGLTMHPRARMSALHIICLLTLALAAPAHAALGGGVETLTRDRDALRGTLRSIPQQTYDVQEITTASGTLVREYSSRTNGGIFAVTWSGVRAPDLQLLLGSYYDGYVAAAKTRHAGHHGLSIDSPGLMATIVRFQRYASGQVYVPALLPRGVTRSELR